MLLVFIIVLTRLIIRNAVAAKTKENQLKLANQQQLIQASITAQEKERGRLAADIHDGLISKLNGLKLQAEIQYADTAVGIVEGLDRCIMTARRISHDLSPPLIEHSSMEDVIEEVIEPYRSSLAITTRIGMLKNIDYSSEKKIQVMRIMEEVTMNVHKHANASELYVRWRGNPTHSLLYVKDDGDGFAMDESKTGLGLQNLESRTQFLNGLIKIHSTLNHGTSILLCFPNN
ncbi:hypothetical protein BST97_15180 [Nonlabens spongiae]|uniref:histidine kinase n=2 Tax=Nonlabens spongiae TaxID=331648 RepID=A0A1W6MNP1_9FLAO|nr:hypothetical protein BST97_15180 [Nonlabens spongiae]